MKIFLISVFAAILLCIYCTDTKDVRIMRKGKDDQKGNVEVSMNGVWTGVCADSNAWDMDAIEVVCGTLHYAYATQPDDSYYVSRNITYSIYDVICSGDEESLFDCAYKNYSEPTYHCETPATAACISADEVLIYLFSLLFSCLFCCCSVMVFVIMCLVIASCPLALLVNNQNNGRNNDGRLNRGEDPTQPLLIANPYSKEKAPPTYTN